MNKTSASLDNCFFYMWVIKWGIENTWGILGCARQSSLDNYTTVSIAAGGECLKSWAVLCGNWNQSSGANFFRARPTHASPVLSFHQEVIQLTTHPPDLSSAESFSRMNSNGFWPVIVPSKIIPREKPYMPVRFILDPATWITRRMQPITVSTNCILSNNPFRFG